MKPSYIIITILILAYLICLDTRQSSEPTQHDKVEQVTKQSVEIKQPEKPTEEPKKPSPVWREVHKTISLNSAQLVYNGKFIDSGADIVILDLFNYTKEQVASITKRGGYPVAYFSAHYEKWRPDAKNLVNTWQPIKSNGRAWPDEYKVDGDLDRNKAVMLARMDLALSKGFKGLDIDNVDQSIDGYATEKAKRYYIYLLKEGRRRGLTMGLKNCYEWLDELGNNVDFFVTEHTTKQEIEVYEQFKKPTVRMYYGNGYKTPSWMLQVTKGKNNSRF